ncbi:hypothetical protein R1sor_022678 [Riccia sorocarpa]|uniref:Uncharacterized protein n=1 Tax=Riccia sorocarpa TaxID=122646 RepID=A0ABD3GMJ8_9MARC
MFSPEEVIPQLDLSKLKGTGLLTISGPAFIGRQGEMGQLQLDISEGALKKLLFFSNDAEMNRVVPPVEMEREFFRRSGYPNYTKAFPLLKKWFRYEGTEKARNEGWFVDKFSKYRQEGHSHGDVLDRRVRFVIRQIMRTIGKSPHTPYCSATLAILAMSHVDPQLSEFCPDWHTFVHPELVRVLLSTKQDSTSQAKFHEGWLVTVDIMQMSYEANEGVVGGKQLQIKNASRAVNAFDDTRAEWDAERGQLVRERDQLKDELLKAQAEAKLLKKHAEDLKTQFEHERSEWERENRQLVEEIASLQDSQVAIAEREDQVQRQLEEFRKRLEAKDKVQQQAVEQVESVQDLKDHIRQKEEEIDRV